MIIRTKGGKEVDINIEDIVEIQDVREYEIAPNVKQSATQVKMKDGTVHQLTSKKEIHKLAMAMLNS